jgi:hypothetical protein
MTTTTIILRKGNVFAFLQQGFVNGRKAHYITYFYGTKKIASKKVSKDALNSVYHKLFADGYKCIKKEVKKSEVA